MSRIARRFEQLRAERRAGFIPFVMAGDPDPAASLALLKRLPAAGADLIELGVAFTDPMADGPVVEAAGRRALAAGQTLAKTLDMARAFRVEDADTPLILMGYANPFFAYGARRLATDAAAAGVDGFIIVDLPPDPEPEAALDLAGALRSADLDVVRLAAPTSDDARLAAISSGASGFVYYVSIAGVTGAAAATPDAVSAAVARLRGAAGLPVAVGFGVKTPEQAAETARAADAVVVGSAIVSKIAAAGETLVRAGGDVDIAFADALELTRALASAVRGARA
ncbi:MAG: tryptophan synthase subunit alpha [Parvularculaceae bacterium]